MNLIEVKVNIDIDNNEQLQSFNDFIQSLKSNGGSSPVATVPVKDIKPKISETAQMKPAETAKPVSAQPQPGANAGEHTAVKEIDAIRKLIGEKVGVHRSDIKAKLLSYGCESATDLPVDRYIEFKAYLESL